MSIDGLDEVFVNLVVQQINVRGSLVLSLKLLSNQLAAKVHVDEPRGRQLGVLARESGGEPPLVVVVAIPLSVVLATDVDDGVARLERLGVARAHEGAVAVRGEHAQHVHGEGLVGVEVAVVRADEDVCLESLGSGFGHCSE